MFISKNFRISAVIALKAFPGTLMELRLVSVAKLSKSLIGKFFFMKICCGKCFLFSMLNRSSLMVLLEVTLSVAGQSKAICCFVFDCRIKLDGALN